MISIKNLSKSFTLFNDKNIDALSNINLEINQAEIFAIIGSSGAGKSTLLRCINLLEQPTSGSVAIDGIDLMSLSELQLRLQRKNIAMIFQHFNLINNKTVFENIALPLRINGEFKQKKHKITELLKLVELTDKVDAYPNQLSGGQKQRVAIARALISEPKVLLCDEATSALDPQTTSEVLNLLKKINQELKLTIVLITHEMSVVRKICHRFALIEKGKITEVSSLEKLFKSHQADHLLFEDLKPKIPDYIQMKISTEPKKNYSPLWQIMFYGKISQEAIISKLSKQYNLEFNILLANIDAIGEHSFGILVLQIKGDHESLKSAMIVFKQKQLNVELLGYVE